MLLTCVCVYFSGKVEMLVRAQAVAKSESNRLSFDETE